jgi:hypothetical protein
MDACSFQCEHASGDRNRNAAHNQAALWRTFASLPHRAEGHTTVLSSRLVVLVALS